MPKLVNAVVPSSVIGAEHREAPILRIHFERGDLLEAASIILHRMLCDGSTFHWSAKEEQAA